MSFSLIGRSAGGSRDGLPPMEPWEPSAAASPLSVSGKRPETIRPLRTCDPEKLPLRRRDHLANRPIGKTEMPRPKKRLGGKCFDDLMTQGLPFWALLTTHIPADPGGGKSTKGFVSSESWKMLFPKQCSAQRVSSPFGVGGRGPQNIFGRPRGRKFAEMGSQNHRSLVNFDKSYLCGGVTF